MERERDENLCRFDKDRKPKKETRKLVVKKREETSIHSRIHTKSILICPDLPDDTKQTC
jgi:hypothetical protein